MDAVVVSDGDLISFKEISEVRRTEDVLQVVRDGQVIAEFRKWDSWHANGVSELK